MASHQQVAVSAQFSALRMWQPLTQHVLQAAGSRAPSLLARPPACLLQGACRTMSP